jgi:hypothetical protein
MQPLDFDNGLKDAGKDDSRRMDKLDWADESGESFKYEEIRILEGGSRYVFDDG